MSPEPAVGVIGGSGLYSLFDDGRSQEVDTPYGNPSGPIIGGTIEGAPAFFVPRHGPAHSIPPYNINYRANIWALRQVGAVAVVSVTAVGSLRSDHEPGSVIICDQLIDATYGRAQTFFDGPDVQHVSFADPFCTTWRARASAAANAAGFVTHSGGTVVTIQGPRYSTRAESRRYARSGADVIGMTQCPEAALAREAGLCYVMVGIVTDYDAGVDDDPTVPAVEEGHVAGVLGTAIPRIRGVVTSMISDFPKEVCPQCHRR